MFSLKALLSAALLLMTFENGTAKQVGKVDERKVISNPAKAVKQYGLTKKFAEQLFSSAGTIRCPLSMGRLHASAGLINSNQVIGINAHVLVKRTELESGKYQCDPYPPEEIAKYYFESFSGEKEFVDPTDVRYLSVLERFLPGCRDPEIKNAKYDLLLIRLSHPFSAFPFDAKASEKVAVGTPILVVSSWHDDVEKQLKLSYKKFRPIMQECDVRYAVRGAFLTDCDQGAGASGGLIFDVTDPLIPTLVGANVSIKHDSPSGSEWHKENMSSVAAAYDNRFLVRMGVAH